MTNNERRGSQRYNMYDILNTDVDNEDKYGKIEENLIWVNEPIVKIGEINIESPLKITAKLLAQMGNECMKFINKNHHFGESYRIELVPLEHPTWTYQLHLKPTVWFDSLYYKNDIVETEKIDVIEKSWLFINKIRSKYHPRFLKSEHNPVPSRLYCRNHADCISGK